MTNTRVVAGWAVPLVAGVIAAVSCSSTGSPGGADPSSESMSQSAPELPWKDKSREQRLAHMKSVVHPTMRALFVQFDSARYADLDCRTCHGPGASDGIYRMPNPELPQLPGGAGGFERLLAEKEEATTFMANVVVPAMARMLGEKPYGPDARDGFACFRCHTAQR